MPPAERTIRKFNPGTFQSDAEVSEQFVVRHHELDITLEVLRDNIDSESCQHQLVIAPRGRGKTMLLARVAAELRSNPAYSDKLLPVRFMEESHEVLDIGDFWLEALYYLAKECAASAPELARELQGVHAHLAAQWRDPRLRHRARATVLDAADRLDRQLVLMVENLQTLCEDADDDFGWELRESLQMEPKVMLLGTATSRFEALDDAQEAFFELFRITVLNPLDTHECGRLWEAVTGNEVERDEIRPIEILTGGSPRLLVIVADFARHNSFRQLLEKVVTLVDDHTEYFRGHLDVLPKTERRVYLATLALWRPSSTSEIAARARMGVRITSAMLGRLVDRGALVAAGGKRTRRYAAAERLYCIYYKIRRERDEAAVVQNLIRFMTLYYAGRRPAGEVRCALAKEVENSPAVDDAEARDIREELVRVFGQSPAPQLQGVVAKSYVKLALTMQAKGDLTGAIGTCQTEEEIRKTVAQALELKGEALRRLDRVEEALGAYCELQERFGDVVGSNGVSMEWAALSARMSIQYVQGNVEAARRLLRALYTATDMENDQNVIAMHVHVASLAAARVERLEELADVLSSDEAKSSTFWPLEVALRGLAGEAVRAPVEVMQVADDIREEVENLRAALPSQPARRNVAR